MGLIESLFTALFGSGRNVVKETVEVFRENAEAAGQREAAAQAAALEQFAREFGTEQRSGFDRFMDALNRIPRPAMALGTLGLFIAAMVDPVWFAARMQGIALVPEPLWWLLGAIVGFYFGARAQTKGQEFQRSIAATLAATPGVIRNLSALQALEAGAGERAANPPAAEPVAGTGPNAALEDWRAGR
ncbi:Holin of 3TMs, for gene-transfer release [Meinhardsimonia xiamenensis]|jgi:hypothetical protein|uniref:Holin of 3TMs, for gene-transfer release n=1 Tax=Meinhardsimonia xiamenensis TaxID=990712 RepID=A0A1G9CXY0_9RHOB|nr:holin family protein [Meinhardsimonia xiamenensis]PRX38202.1 holin (3TMs family) [Meinhardsimonia xiamenensis]SDK56548.1 Holin of 3TMs, for gene-transfer release [Meinhardsimonia xiamenensis]